MNHDLERKVFVETLSKFAHIEEKRRQGSGGAWDPSFERNYQRLEHERSMPMLSNPYWETPKHKYFYLPPTSKNTFPILSVKFDFTRSMPEIRLQMGLFRLKNGKAEGIGLRFEMPEGRGEHHYYHCQMLQKFRDDKAVEGCPSFITDLDVVPAMPLAARNTIQLLLCLLVSLYGAEGIETRLKGTGTLEKRLRSELRSMRISLKSEESDLYGEFHVSVPQSNKTFRCWGYVPESAALETDKENRAALVRDAQEKVLEHIQARAMDRYGRKAVVKRVEPAELPANGVEEYNNRVQL